MAHAMNDLSLFMVPLLAGIATSLFYFGGLWWTVQQLPRAKNPGILVLFSFILRMSVTLFVFYVTAAGRWERILVTVAAFLIARFFLVHWLPKLFVKREPYGTKS
jgi:F1F0 ATPase subunit 2